jgi:XTP/dITP diphosphohydrolase
LIRLYCATGNPGKLREFRMAAAANAAGGTVGGRAGNRPGYPVAGGKPVEIDLLPGYREIPPCVEDGATFEENAAIKALHYAPHASGPLFADDSGLEVDALGGAPGVFSARYSGPGATDESNNRLLIEKLRGVQNRSARFVCAIVLAEGGRIRGVYRGAVEGFIIDEPRGAAGFGYDPLFYCPPLGCTFGEATDERKFSVSHRGKALRAMLAELTGGVPPGWY